MDEGVSKELSLDHNRKCAFAKIKCRNLPDAPAPTKEYRAIDRVSSHWAGDAADLGRIRSAESRHKRSRQARQEWKADIDGMVDLRKKGKTWSEVGKKYGITAAAARWRCRACLTESEWFEVASV